MAFPKLNPNWFQWSMKCPKINSHLLRFKCSMKFPKMNSHLFRFKCSMKFPKMNSHLFRFKLFHEVPKNELTSIQIQMFHEVPKNELTSIQIQMFHEVPKNELTSIQIQMLCDKPHKTKNKSLRKFPKMNLWNKKLFHQFPQKLTSPNRKVFHEVPKNECTKIDWNVPRSGKKWTPQYNSRFKAQHTFYEVPKKEKLTHRQVIRSKKPVFGWFFKNLQSEL
jgi:hypothetical protein